MAISRSNNWPLTPVLIVVFSLAGIFIAPYYFPVPGPTNSMSWEFGFSNTAAQGFIALMLLALFCWMLWRKANAEDLAVVLRNEGERKSARGLLWTMFGVQAVMTAVIMVWYDILPYSHYGELTYFIQRIEEALLGHAPYRNFAFDYGPGMLALPVWIYRLFQGGLSVEAAYTAALVIHFLIGFALLAYMASRVSSGRDQAIIFALLAIPFICITMGLNYTPLRFAAPLAAVFAVRHLYLVSANNAGRRWLLLTGAAVIFPVVNFAISPEMGLALTLALLTYFGWFLFGPERRYALLALPVIAGVAAAGWIFPRAYFASMASFGKGGASFPVLPTIHIIAFLAAAIWVLPRLGVIAIRDRSGLAPFAAGFAVICGLFILPATGRCDAGHVYLNGIGLYLLALAALTRVAPPWRYSLYAIFFVIFTIIDQVSFWDHYDQPIEEAINARAQLSQYPYQADNYADLRPGQPAPLIHYSKLLPSREWLDELPDAKIGLPFGADEGMERYLRLNGQIAPDYHMAPFGDIFEPADLGRKYADLDAMNYIFVPDYYLNRLHLNSQPSVVARETLECKWMPSLLEFPIDEPDAAAGLLLNRDDAALRYLALSGTGETPVSDLFEPGQLEQKFANLLAVDQTTVSEYQLTYLEADPLAVMDAQGVSDCKNMSSLLLFPISLPAIHPLFEADFDIMRRIAQDYVLDRQYPAGVLLKRKDMP